MQKLPDLRDKDKAKPWAKKLLCSHQQVDLWSQVDFTNAADSQDYHYQKVTLSLDSVIYGARQPESTYSLVLYTVMTAEMALQCHRMLFSRASNSEVIASWVTISSVFECCS